MRRKFDSVEPALKNLFSEYPAEPFDKISKSFFNSIRCIEGIYLRKAALSDVA